MGKKRSRWDSPEQEDVVVTTKPKRDKKADTTQSTVAHVSNMKSTASSSSSCVVNDVVANNQEGEDKLESTIATTTSSTTYSPLLYGCRSVENYQRLNFIDQGTYGIVFKAQCRQTGKVVALKQVKMGQLTGKMGFPITALRETNILLFLRHPNIVEVKEMVVGSSIDKIFMVMEYCGKDLRSCIQKSKQSFSTAEIKQLVLQLLSGIAYMHEHWIIHRDLKTSNLLYTNGKLSICDFGMARRYSDPVEPYTREVVTLWYRPPELLLGAATYSTPLDMWSVGCIFAELVLGKPIFPGEGEIDQINKIFAALGAPNELTWPGCTALPHISHVSYRAPSKSKLRSMFPAQNFAGGISLNETGFHLLESLLHMDPNQRITAEEAVHHRWFHEEPLPTHMSNMPMFTDAEDSSIAPS